MVEAAAALALAEVVEAAAAALALAEGPGAASDANTGADDNDSGTKLPPHRRSENPWVTTTKKSGSTWKRSCATP